MPQKRHCADGWCFFAPIQMLKKSLSKAGQPLDPPVLRTSAYCRSTAQRVPGYLMCLDGPNVESDGFKSSDLYRIWNQN